MAEAEHQAKKHLLMEEAVRARKNYEKRAYNKKQNADFMAARVRFLAFFVSVYCQILTFYIVHRLLTNIESIDIKSNLCKISKI